MLRTTHLPGVMERNYTLPTRKTVMFTTSMEKQATAKIKDVVGKPPFLKGEDNTVIVLNDLTRRYPYKGYFRRRTWGETQIVAEELKEDGDMQ